MTATAPFQMSQQSYAAPRANRVAFVQLDGGPGAYRLKTLGGSTMITVQMELSLARGEHDTWQDFFDTTLKFGSLPFNVQLVLQSGGLKSYLAHICQDQQTWGLTGVTGDQYIVGGILEVVESP